MLLVATSCGSLQLHSVLPSISIAVDHLTVLRFNVGFVAQQIDAAGHLMLSRSRLLCIVEHASC